jgi:uncharacterized protein YidB (DUF937 family)
LERRWKENVHMSGFFGKSGGGLAGGLSGSVKMAAVGLLIHQLMKHSRTVAADDGSGAAAATGGGLGGLLGGLLGGASPSSASGNAGGGLGGLLGGGGSSGGGLGSLLGGGGLGGLLGGLGGMLGGLRERGLGQHVDSWVAPGANRPVASQELEGAFDPQELDEAARRAGTDRQGLLDELSRVLPQLVDRATPSGSVPRRDEELGGGGLGGLLNGLLGGDADRQQGTGGSGYSRPRG